MTHTSQPVYPANRPQTHTRMPFKRTHCLYTTTSHTCPHIAIDNLIRAARVNVTRVLQSAHTLCEICDNPFRVPHATHNKIKHLRECESWHVFCNLKRHEREHKTNGERNEKHKTTNRRNIPHVLEMCQRTRPLEAGCCHYALGAVYVMLLCGNSSRRH